MPGPAPSVYSPFIRCGTPSANSTTSTPRWMSPLASAIVLPCSRARMSASSSLFLAMRSRNFISTRARRCGLTAPHPSCALAAFSTAARTSAFEASATCARTVPSIGWKTSAVRPDLPATCLPPMKCPYSIMFRSLRECVVAALMPQAFAHSNVGVRASAVRELAKVSATLRFQSAPNVHHAQDHCASRVEREVGETPERVEPTQVLVERVGDDCCASHAVRCLQGCPQCELKQRKCVPLPLPRPVDRELSEQRHGNRIGLVALPRFWKECALDLRCAQRHVADNPTRCDVCDHVDAGGAARMIVPCMTGEPFIQGGATAVETRPVIASGERARFRNRLHLSFPGGLTTKQLHEPGNIFGRPRRPGLESFPGLRRES